jgi:hypothetical protein
MTHGTTVRRFGDPGASRQAMHPPMQRLPPSIKTSRSHPDTELGVSGTGQR